jgi:tetratricopeptide (TPR) repeat protein
MDRVASFLAFIDQRPDDPFPVYGLAMEHKNAGRYLEAQPYFDRLMERFPDYVAAYFHAAANLVALGRRDDAVARYRRGIEVSARRGDAHARGELEAALADLEGTKGTS